MADNASHRTSSFRPQEFISGGQTGGDSIPFTVFEDLGIPLRGFMPQGFARADGQGRQVAIRYGLSEGEGGNKWRDMKNAETADACLAFLTTLPMTGRGTMQTVNLFVDGRYKHVQLNKPEEQDFLVLEPESSAHIDQEWIQDVSAHRKPAHRSKQVSAHRGKPVIVFWDISELNLNVFACALQDFLERHRPASVMFSGPMESTWPGIEASGAELLKRALACSHETVRGGETRSRFMDVCSVCDGTGFLLQDFCPLCQD